MEDHVYTYPTVVELRAGRGPRRMPRDAGADLRSQPSVTDRLGQRAAKTRAVESKSSAS
jgi:hypothetical protein